MTSPAAPHVNEGGDVHIIDIDIDIDHIIETIDKPDEAPAVKVRIDKVPQVDTLNGNGVINSAKPNPVNIPEAVQKARDAFNRGVTRPLEWRLKQLKGLLRMYEENREAIIEALGKDLRRCKAEVVILEIDFMTNEVLNMIQNLKDWAKPAKPPKSMINLLDEVLIYHEPYGVTLVMGSWNYPLQLLLVPTAGTIAAGNAVIVKPSEVTAASSRFVAETLPKYLDSDAIIVVEGGPEVTTELLKQKFDYIFYTGNSTVGKIIYEAAAKNLTPVTLELGGKSPVYIDDSADIPISAKRILWGKWINVGQTCIAPDYVLCSKATQEKFLEEAKKISLEWYGEDPQKSPDYARIINSRHHSRVQSLIEANKDKVALGGHCDPYDLYVAPTVMINVAPTDKVMEGEIFGPILPIVTVESPNEAIKFINERESPLAIYVFSRHKNIQKLFTEQTRSGSIGINETVMFFGVDSLPFGGVGASGMGAYHGKHTFDTFTHRKGCLKKNFFYPAEMVASHRYPPYTEYKINVVTFAMRKRGIPSVKFLLYLLVFILGVVFAYFVNYWKKDSSED